MATTQLQQLLLSQGWVFHLLLQVGGGEESVKDEGGDHTSVLKLGVESGLAFCGDGSNIPAQTLTLTAGTRPSTHLPEPLDLLAVLGIVPVDSVLLPVAHVYLLHAAQHQLRWRERVSGTRRQPFPLVRHASPTPWQMKASHTSSTISAGSFNSMGNTWTPCRQGPR